MADWPTVAVTAHRKFATSAVGWVQFKIDRAAVWLQQECGTTVAVSGMALGGDQMWARAALHAGLSLHAYVPFPQQPDVWTSSQRAEWRRLVDAADEVIVCGDLAHVPAERRRAEVVRLLHHRNDRMLDASDAVLAVLDSTSTSGGTFSAVQKARRRGMPIVHIDPAARAVTVRVSSVGALGRT